MNLQTFIRASWFIKSLVVTSILVFSTSLWADWKIDFSRRQKKIRAADLNVDPKTPEKSIFDYHFYGDHRVQEIVILNTESGFVPSQIRVREGVKYRVHVVNVNEKSKNISFVMDAFSEHHATIYGKIKSFEIKPRGEGI